MRESTATLMVPQQPVAKAIQAAQSPLKSLAGRGRHALVLVSEFRQAVEIAHGEIPEHAGPFLLREQPEDRLRVEPEHVDLCRPRHGLVVGEYGQLFDLEEKQVELRLRRAVCGIAAKLLVCQFGQMGHQEAFRVHQPAVHFEEPGDVLDPLVAELHAGVEDEDDQGDKRRHDGRLVAEFVTGEFHGMVLESSEDEDRSFAFRKAPAGSARQSKGKSDASSQRTDESGTLRVNRR